MRELTRFAGLDDGTAHLHHVSQRRCGMFSTARLSGAARKVQCARASAPDSQQQHILLYRESLCVAVICRLYTINDHSSACHKYNAECLVTLLYARNWGSRAAARDSRITIHNKHLLYTAQGTYHTQYYGCLLDLTTPCTVYVHQGLKFKLAARPLTTWAMVNRRAY